jgi:arylsulfatase A-like enzyme
LGAHGYHTVVASDYAGEMSSRVRFGFDQIDAPPATSLEVFADREAFQRLPLAMALLTGSFGERLFSVGRYLPVNADPDLLTDRVEAHLDRLVADGRPFLLVVFYSVTHLPFAAPMPDAKAFTRSDYRGPSRYSYEIQQVGDISRLSVRPSENEADQVRALYDGALRSFDRQVGRVVRRLEQIGLSREQRLLIVTGDHGEGLFEPGVTTEHGKWFAGGEAANRTPLLLHGGGVSPGTKAVLASGVDFLPTIADALKLPVPDAIDGVSLLRGTDSERSVFAETALWLGGEASAPPGAIGYPPLVEILEVEPGSHALVLKPAYVDATVTAKLRAIRKGPWELIYIPTKQLTRWQLFNLRDDQFAEHELSSEYPEVFRSLRGELLQWLTRDPLRWLDANDRLVSRTEQ